jgi:hypothetical protein
MRIEVLYFEGCPNYLPAVERLRAVLSQEGLPLGVELIEVKEEAAAKELRFIGSPTIRVNGLDIGGGFSRRNGDRPRVPVV